MSDKPTYINGVFANEITFQDGGSLIKLSIPADKIDELARQLRESASDGWVRLKLSRMREAKVNSNGKTIATHSLSVDNWKPKHQAENNNPWA